MIKEGYCRLEVPVRLLSDKQGEESGLIRNLAKADQRWRCIEAGLRSDLSMEDPLSPKHVQGQDAYTYERGSTRSFAS